MSALTRKYYHLRGHVQGVGFRWFVSEMCESRGFTGWVRTLPGGCVEMEAQGDPAEFPALENDLKTGNPAARVTEMREETLPVMPGEKDFSIRF